MTDANSTFVVHSTFLSTVEQAVQQRCSCGLILAILYSLITEFYILQVFKVLIKHISSMLSVTARIKEAFYVTCFAQLLSFYSVQ